MACSIIKTNNSLILFLKIEPDDELGSINTQTSDDIKNHIQKTLLSRHYKKFVWDVKGISKIDSQILARILMSYEKAMLTKCQFFILNMEDNFLKMMKIFKFNRIIKMKTIKDSPKLERLDDFFEKEEVSIFDEELIKNITNSMHSSLESKEGLISTLGKEQLKDNTIKLDFNLLDSISNEITHQDNNLEVIHIPQETSLLDFLDIDEDTDNAEIEIPWDEIEKSDSLEDILIEEIDIQEN